MRVAWLKFRKSFEQQLLENGADYIALDEVCDREVWRVIAQIRKQRVYSPYVVSARLAWGWVKLKWRLLREQYRIPATQVHSGPDPASGAGAGTAGITTAGFTTGIPITGAGFAGISAGVVPAANSSTPVFEDAGIKAGEVTAYRCWQLGDDGLLHSVIYTDFVWEPGKVAEGNPSDPHAGIYAYKSVLLLHKYGSIKNRSVTGTVDLWGEVYEHEHGYRAQYAAISSIHDSPYYDAKALRKRYGLTRRRKKK